MTAIICGTEYPEGSNIIVETAKREYHCIIVNGQIRARNSHGRDWGEVTARSKTITPEQVVMAIPDPTCYAWEESEEA